MKSAAVRALGLGIQSLLIPKALDPEANKLIRDSFLESEPSQFLCA